MGESVFREMAAKTVCGFNLRCIDGTLHGQNKCVGFCAYEQHPGFLTVQQEQSRQCREKGCFYHHPKPAVQRSRRDTEALKRAEIIAAAERATAELEGLRVLRADKESDGGWTIWYASIAGYDLTEAEAQIRKTAQCQISMKQLRCDFDTAVALVTGQKLAYA